MKTLTTLLISLFLIGCTNRRAKREALTNGYEAIKIDGCQYVIYDDYKVYGIVHKGNCNNPIHERK